MPSASAEASRNSDGLTFAHETDTMNASVPFWSGTRLHLTVPVTQRSRALLPCRTGLGFRVHRGLAAALSTASLCLLSWLNTGAFDAHYRTLALVAALVVAILAVIASVPLYRRFPVYLKSPQLISGRVPLAAAWFSLMACMPVQNLARRYFRQQRRGPILGSGIGSATGSAGLAGVNNAALLLDIKTPFTLQGKENY